jgi:hypothetical protein
MLKEDLLKYNEKKDEFHKNGFIVEDTTKAKKEMVNKSLAFWQ